ncbi:MAG: 2-hydroxyacid dehydrogenase [Candidatus Gastranaerophilales bacterium]|nr:2-hydroxyacid dehydrogenase [Candidatus Gastranaerophilales bacterium]
MQKIVFFDTKPYDKIWFDKLNNGKYEFVYLENKLCKETVILAKGAEVICAFVNDVIDKDVINNLYNFGVKVILMRCAGYNNVDFKSAYEKITVLRVPAYSPYAVAEHTFGMLLALNRKLHKAYNRTRDFNFNLNGLTGFDLHNKTIGIMGTGKIGQIVINIAQGFGMNIIAYDAFPNENSDINYVSLDNLFKMSDIISLHCPLNKETKHMINQNSISKMRDGVYIINTSRGALINSNDLLTALQNEKIKGACLDVYEEEAEWFFEDKSEMTSQDETLSLLVNQPNVLLTSHQAFLTNEALKNIAQTTLQNLDDYFENKPLENEVCYRCTENRKTSCPKVNGRCF